MKNSIIFLLLLVGCKKAPEKIASELEVNFWCENMYEAVSQESRFVAFKIKSDNKDFVRLETTIKPIHDDGSTKKEKGFVLYNIKSKEEIALFDYFYVDYIPFNPGKSQNIQIAVILDPDIIASLKHNKGEWVLKYKGEIKVIHKEKGKEITTKIKLPYLIIEFTNLKYKLVKDEDIVRLRLPD